MKPSKLYEALHALIGERVPLHIWGACGVGKSQIVSQVADDLDYEFLDVRAVQLDPVDLRGLPRIKEDQTEWVPPKFLPTTGKGILFLDELTSAPQMTQGLLASVVTVASSHPCLIQKCTSAFPT
jgi:MoxR-like ATPase